MKIAMMAAAVFCLVTCRVYADGTNPTAEAEGFVRQVVQSLIDGDGAVPFPVADKIFTLDNGEILSKADFREAWPQIAREATRKKISMEQFYRDVDVRLGSPLNNKRLMNNKRIMAAYTPQEGDLYCDASRVKEGVENFIAYDKAFLYIIRKVDGKWTLIGIGG